MINTIPSFLRLLVLFFYCQHAFAAESPFLKFVPKQELFFEEDYLNEDIRKTFRGREDRLQYFLDEITNYPETTPEFFFDYINPEIPATNTILGRSNIYKQILHLKYVERSKEERHSIHDLNRFVSTNYKSERLPAKAYLNNPHLPPPLTVSQLVSLTFNAIPNSDMNALRALVENYNLVNSKDGAGNSLLIHAIMLRKNDIARFLIHNGADINMTNSYGATPLMLAIRLDNFEAAHMLINYGCNLKNRDKTNQSALDYASKNAKMYSLISHAMKSQAK